MCLGILQFKRPARNLPILFTSMRIFNHEAIIVLNINEQVAICCAIVLYLNCMKYLEKYMNLRIITDLEV